jgi:DUF4097 and DUF4098 domain-containing protein YvlB
MNRQFETLQPIDLVVEIGKGRVRISAADTTETTVDVEGPDADEVAVTFEGKALRVIGPKHSGGFFSKEAALDVQVTLPTDSRVMVKTGSADIEVEGQVGDARLKTGSGDVTCDTFSGAASIDTGSGDIEVSEAHAELRVKSGSGDVSVGSCLLELSISTGSGDVEVGTANARTVVKTGSGDLKVVTANDDVSLSTGSGDLTVGSARRGRVSAKGASSDVRIGIPVGTPVWADLNTVTGKVRSSIESVGAPQEGQDHLELEARTVSGDIVLTQV